MKNTARKAARLEAELVALIAKLPGTVIEWWRSPGGKGCYREKRNGRVIVTSQRYSRARDAKKYAYKRGASIGSRVIEVAPPRGKR